jgi:hypothetical protein
VKPYQLFAKTKAEKDAVLQQLVHQTQALIDASQQVGAEVQDTTAPAVKSAVAQLQQMATVTPGLLPQIVQWLATGVGGAGKLVYAGITTARAIVKNKVGKKVEFGLKGVLAQRGEQSEKKKTTRERRTKEQGFTCCEFCDTL